MHVASVRACYKSSPLENTLYNCLLVESSLPMRQTISRLQASDSHTHIHTTNMIETNDRSVNVHGLCMQAFWSRVQVLSANLQYILHTLFSVMNLDISANLRSSHPYLLSWTYRAPVHVLFSSIRVDLNKSNYRLVTHITLFSTKYDCAYCQEV